MADKKSRKQGLPPQPPSSDLFAKSEPLPKLPIGKRGAFEIAVKRHKKIKQQASDTILKLNNTINTQRDIIDHAGEGSRRGQTAREKIQDLEKKKKKEHKKIDRSWSKFKDDFGKVAYSGESALIDRGFSTIYPETKYAGKVRSGVTSKDKMGMKKGGKVYSNTIRKAKRGY